MPRPDTEPRPDEHPEPAPPAGPGRPVTFRPVPLVALVGVGFLALAASTIAFLGSWWFAILLLPAALAWWIVRIRTVVDADGVRVRHAVGSRSLRWQDTTTLRLVERGWVHAVPQSGAELALLGVRVRDLGRVGEASAGRIRVPTPAQARAAAEHERELQAARMRVERLREQQGPEGGATGPAAGPEPENGGRPDREQPDGERADGA